MNFQAWSAPVELIPSVIVPLTCAVPAWAHAQASPSLTLLRLPCARIQYHKTFAGLARCGKTSTGWFYGFKLHLIVNDHGELLDFVLTPGNVNPCPQARAPTLLRRQGIPIALTNSGVVQLITSIRANIAHAAAR
jgi:hypothetical protein